MKKIIWLIILVLMISGGLVVLQALSAEGTSSPDIEFYEELWDFGAIIQGEKVSHIFKVKNVGGTELVINNAKATCGCTAAVISSSKIAPGKSGQIEVTFNSSGYKGMVTKYIYVESNDPDEPRKTLTIKANVTIPPSPKIKLIENSWDLGLITEGEKLTYILSVENTGEQELIISKMNTSSPHCNAKLLSYENIPPGKMGEIRIFYDSTGQKGLVKDYLYINSNDPSRKTVVFPITGYIIESKPELTILPTFLNLGTIEQGEKCTAVIEFKNWGEKKIKIVDISTPSKSITVTPFSQEIEPHKEAKININLNSEEKDIGQIEEYIYLTIAIPIEATIKEK